MPSDSNPAVPNTTDTVGLLLAAGLGKRMGCQKLLLPWPQTKESGDTTVLESAYDGLAPHCPGGIVIVTGNDHASIATAIGTRPCTWVHGDSDAPMFHSITCGLGHILASSSCSSLLIHPADHPAIENRAVNRLFRHAALHHGSDPTVLIPTLNGRGGHPILINRPAALAVLAYAQSHPDPGNGLRGVFDHIGCTIVRIACNDCGWIRTDLDTRSQYEQACEQWRSDNSCTQSDESAD